MRNIYESLLTDSDIERALLLKIADEGRFAVTELEADHPRITLEWRGLVASVVDADAYGPYKCETDYLDNWDDDTAQYHSIVPIRAAAGEIVDMIRANHLRALGLRSED